MKKDYYAKKADMLLRNLNAYKLSIAYYRSLDESSALPLRQAKAVRSKLAFYTRTVEAAEKALALLSATDRRILTAFYLSADRPDFYDLCEEVSLERSSVYRHRFSALDFVGRAVYALE